jgi:hypothetical protein
MRRPSGRGRRPSCGEEIEFQVIVSVDQAEKLGETFGIEVCELHGRFQMPIQTAGT